MATMSKFLWGMLVILDQLDTADLYGGQVKYPSYNY